MTSWLIVALLGGIVAMDTTSFPQVMVSRPLVAGALTGAATGRPVEGLVLGVIMEAYTLLVLPIGAARYPESGTATVAAVGAYVAVAPPGIEPGRIALVVAFALAWEWLAGGTVILLRRANGRILLRSGRAGPRALERRHLAAMGLDFVRGAVVATSGGLVAAALLHFGAPAWALEESVTLSLLTVLTIAMIGTAVPVFGGVRARRYSLLAGLGVGLVLAGVLA